MGGNWEFRAFIFHADDLGDSIPFFPPKGVEFKSILALKCKFHQLLKNFPQEIPSVVKKILTLDPKSFEVYIQML